MERNRSVLLIDADVIKASASELLGIPDNQPGLTDLINDPSMDVESVVFDTDVRNLQCMCAGSNTDHATELLSSDAMKQLISQLASHYPQRIIIFDAPPVLQTSEALVLAEQVGQIAFVVGAESTTHSMVSEALARLPDKAWQGMILNKMQKTLTAGYGYGYEDGYGQGHPRDKERAQRRSHGHTSGVEQLRGHRQVQRHKADTSTNDWNERVS